jgi:DNA-binding PadR family transcriptional regulator
MPGILKFETANGQQKGILAIYILFSLKRKPKSGYELLTEIKEKTEGAWVPSKGTVYPLLKQLQSDGFIKLKTREKRSKNIFEITSKGKKMILNKRKQGENMMKIIMKFRNLVIDILEKDAELVSTLMNIQDHAFRLSKEKKCEVTKILKRCASDLQKEAV